MGQSLKIPLLMQSLTQKYDYILNGAKVFILDRAMREYLESGVVAVPGGNITNFLYDWWNQSDLPIDSTSLFSIFTLAKCLAFHDKEVNQQPLIAGPGPIPPAPPEHLNKPNYGWHDSTWCDPNRNHCPRCRLYRATAVGLMNELKDVENLVNAVETTHQAESALSIRRASGLNQLYEAAVARDTKGSETGQAAASRDTKGSKSGQAAASRETKGSESGQAAASRETKGSDSGVAAASKWTFGTNLCEADLNDLVRGADHNFVLPHTGYNESLSEGSLPDDSAGCNK